MKNLLLLTLLLVSATVSHAQVLLLEENFTLNTANVSSQKPKNLGSGEWLFYYTDQSNGSSIKQCAMLKYSGSNMGYIISPSLSKPAVLTFDARAKGKENYIGSLEILKSTDGGTNWTLVESLLVPGMPDKSIEFNHYTVMINETNDNVKLKFQRTKPVGVSNGDNYNIIIDNVEVWSAPESDPDPDPDPDTEAVLQILNGTKSMDCDGELCIRCYDGSPYMDIPFTLKNTGSAVLQISNIVTTPGCSVGDNTQYSIAANESAEIMVRIDCTGEYAGRCFTVHSNNSSGCGNVFKINFAAE